MRNSLTVLTAVSCLVLATSSFGQGKPHPLPPGKTLPAPADKVQKMITYVEIIQIDPQSQAFSAKLINVDTGMVLLEATGQGAQLQDFKQKSGALAPSGQTVTLMGPSPHTADIIVKPPNPPGPAGGDLLHLATQVARSYEASLAQQLKLGLQPAQIRPRTLDPRVLPGAQPSMTNPNAQPTNPAPKK